MGKIQYINEKYLGSILNTQNVPNSQETLFIYFVSNTDVKFPVNKDHICNYAICSKLKGIRNLAI